MNSFEDEKSKDEYKDLVIYEEPQAMMSCNLPFQELGVDKVEDCGRQTRQISRSVITRKLCRRVQNSSTRP